MNRDAKRARTSLFISNSPEAAHGRPGGPYTRHACSSCRKKKVKCIGEGSSCVPCQRSGIECTRGSEPAKRPITRQYVESLEKHNEALDQHVSLLESKLAQCQTEHGGLREPQLHSRPVMPPILLSDLDVDMIDEETTGESDSDTDGDPEMKKLIVPTKRLVLQDGDVHFYGSFSPFAHAQVPQRASRFPQAYENYNSRFVLILDDADEIHYNPNFDWSRHLPAEVPLHRREHDKLLDLLFKFVTSWCLRIVPILFLRDMFRALSVPPSQPPPRTSHYSPMLHNALLALALAFSDDPRLCDLNSRQYFARKAKSYIEAECQSPNISVVHALSFLASFHSSLGDQTLGYMYFGMSGRISQVLGLSIDSSPLVKSSHITHDDMLDRNWAHWTTFSQDVCWSLYVGREFCVVSPSDQQRIPVPFVDPAFDQIKWRHPVSGLAPQPGFLSTTFANSCELLRIARWIMDVVSGFRKRPDVNHAIISKIDVQLNTWKGRLPPEVDITPSNRATALPHRLMLHLAYWWLFILLHRPFYRRSRTSPASESVIDHVKLCNKAAEHIMELLATWRTLYALRYVPIMWIQIVYSAGTIFLLSAAQASSGPRIATQSLSHSLLQAELCIQYLSEAGKSWQTARHVKDILQKLLAQLTTRMEARTSEPTRRRNSKRRKSPLTVRSSSRSREGSSAIPITHSPTSSIQESGSPYSSSPEHMRNPVFPPPVPSFEAGSNNQYEDYQYAPTFDGGGDFRAAGHFGFSGIPGGGNLNPQNFLTFGDPGFAGFGGRHFQQDSDPNQYPPPESQNHEMDVLDQFWASSDFF